MTPFETTQIYAQPDGTSTVAGLLHYGEFAAVLGVSPNGAWIKVDLAQGSTEAQAVGWADQSVLLLQGSCGSIPTLGK